MLFPVAALLLAACGAAAPVATPAPVTAPTAAPAPTVPPSATQEPTPTAPSVAASATNTVTLPAISNAAQRVLFINGDHLPETGYPHSRLFDDGSKPESFTLLRDQILLGELKTDVQEYILTASNTISPAQLTGFALVVLGSNGRVLTAEEVSTLTNYYNDGGNILIYADFQYGPTNWASDNSFLSQFNVEVFPDNFQPLTVVTDVVRPEHPIMAGVTQFATEGSSQFLIKAESLSQNIVLSKCSPLERLGCAVQAPEQAKIGAGDTVACTWVRESAGGGRMAGTCDRNTFHNGPGVGTWLSQFDNTRYATNLFRWLLG
jgi:hypothetical protein